MNISLGNMSFEQIGNKEKMIELETKLREIGYEKEENCERNRDTTRLTYHIYDMPRTINFSVLDNKTITLLKEYSSEFSSRTGVSAELIK